MGRGGAVCMYLGRPEYTPTMCTDGVCRVCLWGCMGHARGRGEGVGGGKGSQGGRLGGEGVVGAVGEGGW